MFYILLMEGLNQLSLNLYNDDHDMDTESNTINRNVLINLLINLLKRKEYKTF